eukprot:1647314-Pleurochrysis_carterae.AAC.1
MRAGTWLPLPATVAAFWARGLQVHKTTLLTDQASSLDQDQAQSVSVLLAIVPGSEDIWTRMN